MTEVGLTVRAAIIRAMPELTATERKLAQAVLADYPFTGLQTVVELARLTGASAPSITRFVGKIGFAGYAEFQRRLIAELKEGRRSPLDLMPMASHLPEADFLREYAARIATALREMGETVPADLLADVCALLADPGRRIFVLGGRISDTMARYLAVHLQQMRENVVHLPQLPEHWPGHLLHMRRRDVLVLFDFRRYQPDLARLARLARRDRGVRIVLVTDKWLSPIAREATHVFGLPIGVGTAWDTGATALALAEAIIVKVAEADRRATRARIAALDALRRAADPASGATAPSPFQEPDDLDAT